MNKFDSVKTISQTFVGAKEVVRRGNSGRASPEEQPRAPQPGSLDTGNATSVGLGETVSSTKQFSSIVTLSVPRGSSPEEERLSMEEERPIMSDHHEANANEFETATVVHELTMQPRWRQRADQR